MAKPGCLVKGQPLAAGQEYVLLKLPPTYIWLAPMNTSFGPSEVSAWAVKFGSVIALPLFLPFTIWPFGSKAARCRWGVPLGQLTPRWPSGGWGLSCRQASLGAG